MEDELTVELSNDSAQLASCEMLRGTNGSPEAASAAEKLDEPHLERRTGRDPRVANPSAYRRARLPIELTETDTRRSFDSPLDLKFRADAMGRTVLFIGYAMHD
jgi:hypothetical protein